MQPLVSVMVPVYNGQDYLENCIKSIKEQTYPSIEIVIVNDGSTDETGSVCDELLQKYDNLQVITMNDEGVSAARNAGMRKATGEYLMFADADDRLHPKAVQMLYDALIQTDSDVASCGFFMWTTEEEWQQEAGTESDVTVRSMILQRDEFLEKGILGNDTRCWGKLYKRNLIGEHTYREGLTIGEDMLFLLEILPDMKKMVSIPFKGYGYYQNSQGAMNRKFSPRYMDQIACWELARDRILKMDYSLNAQVTSVLLISIMLTAGKLALLSAKERKQNRKYISVCREKLKMELQIEGAYERLSGGYKLKTQLFAKAPELYLGLYHFRKYFG